MRRLLSIGTTGIHKATSQQQMYHKHSSTDHEIQKLELSPNSQFQYRYIEISVSHRNGAQNIDKQRHRWPTKWYTDVGLRTLTNTFKYE